MSSTVADGGGQGASKDSPFHNTSVAGRATSQMLERRGETDAVEERGPMEDPLCMTTSLGNTREGFLGFASGLVAGIIGVLTGYPLDTLKVKMQVYGSGSRVALLDENTGRNPVRIVRQLFRGVLPPLLSTGLVQTLNFGVYDNTLRYLRVGREEQKRQAGRQSRGLEEREEGSASYHGPNVLPDFFIAGAVGGAAISIITCPASLVKIQVQTATSSSVTYWTVLAGMRRKGLVAGYYRAFVPDVLNQMVGRGVYMCTYEALKRLLHPSPPPTPGTVHEPPSRLHHQSQPLYQRILAGALAGVCGWLCIYPLDVVKSRLQADALAPGANRYTTMTDCFRQSYRAGGLRSLYSGLGYTLLRAVPVASVILPCYDATYHVLARHLDE